MPLTVTDTIEIADWELVERFQRAGGPGGQHVNKVSTAVELRFAAERSPNLPDWAKRRLKALAGQRWTQHGEVVIVADGHRSQLRNREAARERLVALIRQSLERPKVRRKTRPTKASQERRLKAKSVRSKIKANRRRTDD
ncbi:MAG: alternative ribosome rescue aminoacyl-tRNA hydrolase ArfB [Pseudomonadota bacterium]